MRRYQAMFDRLAAAGQGAFGGFLMIGDPDLPTSARLLDALVEGGADMIEVGIPFSDPVADGPVIQAASVRALESGVRPDDCFALLAAFRERHPDVPVGLLTYANLVVSGGMEDFYARCARAGVDSVLVADVPAAEAPPFAEAAISQGVDPVLIAAPNTPPETLRRIAKLSRGYVYCVARLGVTGSDRAMELQHQALFEALAREEAPPPVLGFGISTAAHVRAALESGAAGAICGSAIVAATQASDDPVDAVRTLVRSLKDGTKGLVAPIEAG